VVQQPLAQRFFAMSARLHHQARSDRTRCHPVHLLPVIINDEPVGADRQLMVGAAANVNFSVFRMSRILRSARESDLAENQQNKLFASLPLLWL
jgi:hypothetical protein